MSRLSYTGLGEYNRCGYRFYAERVLGLPPVPMPARASASRDGLTGAERGVLAHAALERLDFRRPRPVSVTSVVPPGERAPGPDEAAELDALIRGLAEGELCRRLGRASEVRREERFAFLLGEVLVTGAFDVFGREPPGRTLVVDYKSDRLAGADPARVAERAYSTQRVVYALAALRARAEPVEVVHVFLEAPDAPVIARFDPADAEKLEQELRGLAAGVLASEFRVTEAPQRSICSGCPAEGGLCSWGLEMTRREAADTLF